MDVLTFETCIAVNSEIIKQVTSSWSIFIQLSTVYVEYFMSLQPPFLFLNDMTAVLSVKLGVCY